MTVYGCAWSASIVFDNRISVGTLLDAKVVVKNVGRDTAGAIGC